MRATADLELAKMPDQERARRWVSLTAQEKERVASAGRRRLTRPHHVQGPVNGALVEDNSLGLDKQGRKRLDHSKRAPDVDVVQPLRLGDVGVQQWAVEFDASVVHQDIEAPARAFRDYLLALRDGLWDGHVQLEDLDVS